MHTPKLCLVFVAHWAEHNMSICSERNEKWVPMPFQHDIKIFSCGPKINMCCSGHLDHFWYLIHTSYCTVERKDRHRLSRGMRTEKPLRTQGKELHAQKCAKWQRVNGSKCSLDFMDKKKTYLIIFEASSASGSAQYLLARIKHASADSIYGFKRRHKAKVTEHRDLSYNSSLPAW